MLYRPRRQKPDTPPADTTNYNHVMIDIETMDTKPGASIVSIGAVKFCPIDKKISNDVFYQELCWEMQERSQSVSTVKWWSTLNPEVRKALHGSKQLDNSLREFSAWIGKRNIYPWGNGSVFDICILENAYDSFGITIPWKFWNVRDHRTLKHLYENSFGKLALDFKGYAHNALDDAKNQANEAIHMWDFLSQIKTIKHLI